MIYAQIGAKVDYIISFFPSISWQNVRLCKHAYARKQNKTLLRLAYLNNYNVVH